MQRELAWHRQMLAKYGNDHDNKLSWTDMEESNVPLTLGMINKWTQALVHLLGGI